MGISWVSGSDMVHTHGAMGLGVGVELQVVGILIRDRDWLGTAKSSIHQPTVEAFNGNSRILKWRYCTI